MKNLIKRTIISLMIIAMVIMIAPLQAHAVANDWRKERSTATFFIGICVSAYTFYTYNILPLIHYSVCDNDPNRSHITFVDTNGNRYYYYGRYPQDPWNIAPENIPFNIRNEMIEAWNNFVNSIQPS